MSETAPIQEDFRYLVEVQRSWLRRVAQFVNRWEGVYGDEVLVPTTYEDEPELPTYAAGDALKHLRVNAAGNAVEWHNPNGDYLQIANNLSDLAAVATARTNLGLGTAAVADVGTDADEVAAGNHNHNALYLQIANNLSDLGDAATARTNLGLGNSAVRNVGTAAGQVAHGNHDHNFLTGLQTDLDGQGDGYLAFTDSTGTLETRNYVNWIDLYYAGATGGIRMLYFDNGTDVHATCAVVEYVIGGSIPGKTAKTEGMYLALKDMGTFWSSEWVTAPTGTISDGTATGQLAVWDQTSEEWGPGASPAGADRLAWWDNSASAWQMLDLGTSKAALYWTGSGFSMVTASTDYMVLQRKADDSLGFDYVRAV